MNKFNWVRRASSFESRESWIGHLRSFKADLDCLKREKKHFIKEPHAQTSRKADGHYRLQTITHMVVTNNILSRKKK